MFCDGLLRHWPLALWPEHDKPESRQQSNLKKQSQGNLNSEVISH